MVRNLREKGILQLTLRTIAVTAMFVYNFGVAFDDAISMNAGWISFPIFAFMLTDGFNHSVNRLRYALRLLVFAALSEPLFDLMKFGSGFDASEQNIMFTLLIGYFAIWALDIIRNRIDNYFVTLVSIVLLITAGRIACEVLCTELSEFGVGIIIMFYIADKVSYPKLLEIATVLYIAFYKSSNAIGSIKVMGIQYEICIEIFALAALLFIWMYNEERGPNSIVLKIVYYTLYPVQLLFFYIVKMFI